MIYARYAIGISMIRDGICMIRDGMRRMRIELIHIWRLGHGNGVVAVGIAEAPTVQNDECGFHAAKVAPGSTP